MEELPLNELVIPDQCANLAQLEEFRTIESLCRIASKTLASTVPTLTLNVHMHKGCTRGVHGTYTKAIRQAFRAIYRVARQEGLIGAGHSRHARRGTPVTHLANWLRRQREDASTPQPECSPRLPLGVLPGRGIFALPPNPIGQ